MGLPEKPPQLQASLSEFPSGGGVEVGVGHGELVQLQNLSLVSLVILSLRRRSPVLTPPSEFHLLLLPGHLLPSPHTVAQEEETQTLPPLSLLRQLSACWKYLAFARFC